MDKITITTGENGKGRFYNGLPSITTVLPSPECPKGMTPEQWRAILDKAAAFGTIIHDGCHQIAAGDTPSVEVAESDAEKAGQLLSAYWEWFEANVTEVLHCEEPFVNKQYSFGGTPDLIVILNGSDKPVIIDIKAIWPPSKTQQTVYEMQLAAQGMLTDENYRRISLRLRKEAPEKPPQIKEYPHNDERAALVEMRFLNYLEGYKLEQKMNGGK